MERTSQRTYGVIHRCDRDTLTMPPLFECVTGGGVDQGQPQIAQQGILQYCILLLVKLKAPRLDVNPQMIEQSGLKLLQRRTILSDLMLARDE